jgi:hypothetical protein
MNQSADLGACEGGQNQKCERLRQQLSLAVAAAEAVNYFRPAKALDYSKVWQSFFRRKYNFAFTGQCTNIKLKLSSFDKNHWKTVQNTFFQT